MSEWQPIDTAPKDGTFITVKGGYYDTVYSNTHGPIYNLVNHPTIVQWVAMVRPPSWMVSEDGLRLVSNNGLSISKPTHWMPLPKLPEVKE